MKNNFKFLLMGLALSLSVTPFSAKAIDSEKLISSEYIDSDLLVSKENADPKRNWILNLDFSKTLLKIEEECKDCSFRKRFGINRNFCFKEVTKTVFQVIDQGNSQR